MTCPNKCLYHVPRGFSYRAVYVRCGLTDPFGGRAVCHECSRDPAKAADIAQHEANIKADNEAAASAGWGEF